MPQQQQQHFCSIALRPNALSLVARGAPRTSPPAGGSGGGSRLCVRCASALAVHSLLRKCVTLRAHASPRCFPRLRACGGSAPWWVGIAMPVIRPRVHVNVYLHVQFHCSAVPPIAWGGFRAHGCPSQDPRVNLKSASHSERAGEALPHVNKRRDRLSAIDASHPRL